MRIHMDAGKVPNQLIYMYYSHMLILYLQGRVTILKEETSLSGQEVSKSGQDEESGFVTDTVQN